MHGIYPVGRQEEVEGEPYPARRVIVRFRAADVTAVVRALEDAGFAVLESVDECRPAHYA
jgi:hypothetical protein